MRYCVALLLCLLLAQSAGAVGEISHVIDPDGQGNYTSLSAWDSAEAGDLVASNSTSIAVCRCTGGTAHGTYTQSDNWTTDATRYIKIWTDPNESYRHNGIMPTSGNVFRIEGSTFGIYLNANHVRVIGIAVQSNGYTGIYLSPSGTSCFYVEQCVVTLTGSAYYDNGVYVAPWYCVAKISNNIIYGFDGTGCRGIYVSTGLARSYNNTIYDCTVGIYKHTDANNDTYLYNNIVQNCTTGINNNGTDWEAEDYTISCDTNDLVGAHSSSAVVVFVASGSSPPDLHLSDNDTAAKDNGTDLSGDGSYPITVDIDNDTRSAPWDIGADETTGEAEEDEMDTLRQLRGGFWFDENGVKQWR